jgi:DNA polymerase II small subunit/DNA polymerase delta subunit B
MHDLVNEVSALSKSLDEALKAFRKRGEEYAAAERDYRIALSTKILQERDRSTPVTIISDVCRGSHEIAALKFKETAMALLILL